MQSAKPVYTKKAPLFLAIFSIMLLTISCSKEKPYLYDKTGFDPGEQPQNSGQNGSINKIAPDYYYRQPAYSNYQYPPQPQAYQQPYYPPAQQYQQPNPYYYQPQNYQPQVIPGSRFYSNPYAIPPSSRYPNYDADQYYVPPTQYNNNSEAAPVLQPSLKNP
jgi:hypothetical protein